MQRERNSTHEYNSCRVSEDLGCSSLRGVAGESHHKLGQAGDGGRGGSETEQPTTGLVVPSSGRDAACADTAAAAESKPVDEAIAAEVSAEQEDEGGRLLPTLRRCSSLDFVSRKRTVFAGHRRPTLEHQRNQSEWIQMLIPAKLAEMFPMQFDCDDTTVICAPNTL